MILNLIAGSARVSENYFVIKQHRNLAWLMFTYRINPYPHRHNTRGVDVANGNIISLKLSKLALKLC